MAKADKENRVLVSVHLHRERDKVILEWMNQLADTDRDFSASAWARKAMYEYATNEGMTGERSSGQGEVMNQLDWIASLLQHNDLSERVTQLTGLVQQIIHKINTGSTLSQVQEEVNASLNPGMLKHMKQNVVRPGKGTPPPNDDDM